MEEWDVVSFWHKSCSGGMSQQQFKQRPCLLLLAVISHLFLLYYLQLFISKLRKYKDGYSGFVIMVFKV